MELSLTNQCDCDLDDCGKTHVEFIFNKDDSAHAACVWQAAKELMRIPFYEENPKYLQYSKEFINDKE